MFSKAAMELLSSIVGSKSQVVFIGIVENLEKCGAYHAKNLNEILKHNIDSY
jgi:hypothetical protein